ncbi:regulator of G-protein signaling 14a isoform X2 [Silurus meridionalis]|uniref:regulator of G-protein signaling 14a isoform X2 n=1 Tax=Silurus meridionalis TaxID=175797 RepID=UPI001EE9F011|nr:regulator of G-protein signaling 14a isoform X2 [Silurus meridionalis]
MVAVRGLTRAVVSSCSSTSAWIKRNLRGNTTKMLQKERKTQAVSDGELNMSRLSGTGSSPSLSTSSAGGEAPGEVDGLASRVVSWAVCFERLMEDPVGVRYFTAFLNSEVSAENILFWQACEKFQKIPPTNVDELKKQARSIFDLYISESSFNAVNIDDTARINERDLEKPTTEMFSKAQQQIYKLMKFDSYARFVRSPLYQNCMLASVEGRPLPDLEPQNKSVTPNSGRKTTNVKTPSSDSKATKNKKIEKRGSWGDLSYRQVTVSRQESQISVKSSSSVELGSLANKSDDGCLSGPEPNSSGRADKYCCVFLPDGTASLAPARAGMTLRDMLSGLCEKRGFPMKDIVIYLQGKDKNVCQRQQPLSLDQDSSVLQDQQVTLELRITFTLEIVFTGKTIVIMAKSSKTLADAVSSVLQKQQLRQQDAIITLSGSNEPLNMDTTVLRLSNKTLCLDKVKNGAGGGGGDVKPSPAVDRVRISTKPRNEMDGLVEMLTRVQCSRADDQRGLLTKEQLELPKFLQIPAQQYDRKSKEENPEKVQERCSNSHMKPAEKAVNHEEMLRINGNHKDSNVEKNKTGAAKGTSH